MDPEFERIMTWILGGAGVVFAIATIALVVWFRGFSKKGAGKRPHMLIVAGLLLFIFIACFVLFLISHE